MKIISHRGNVNGPITDDENKPSYIDCAIQSGYGVEIDVRCANGQFYLGHDLPTYVISSRWILDRSKELWVHCKNLEAAHQLGELSHELRCFCHTSDSYVWITNGNIWVHDVGLTLNDKCVIPLMTKQDIENYNGGVVYGICTDFVKFAEYNLTSKGLFKK